MLLLHLDWLGGVLRIKLGIGISKNTVEVALLSGRVRLGIGLTKPSFMKFNFLLVSANLPTVKCFSSYALEANFHI